MKIFQVFFLKIFLGDSKSSVLMINNVVSTLALDLPQIPHNFDLSLIDNLISHVSKITVGTGVMSTGALNDGEAAEHAQIFKIKISIQRLSFH